MADGRTVAVTRPRPRPRPRPRQGPPTLLLAATLGAAAALGLLRQRASYPSDALAEAFVPDDAINAAFGIPLLVVCRGRRAWLLPGALAYHGYNSLAYVLALGSAVMRSENNNAVIWTLLSLHVASCGMSVVGFRSAYGAAVHTVLIHKAERNALGDGRSSKYSGAVLMLWGFLFFLRAAAGLIDDSGTSEARNEAESAVLIADLLLGPCWVWGGWIIFLHGNDRLALGVNLLFQGASLFVALVLLLLARPVLLAGEGRVDIGDVIVVAAMGLTVLVPCVLIYSRISSFHLD